MAEENLKERNNTDLREPIDKAWYLDERAILARESEREMERLIEDCEMFLRSRASRFSSRLDSAQRDELYVTAMYALYEATQRYDIAKGHFFPFADHVIRGRIIDEKRKQYRHAHVTVPFEDEGDSRATAQSAYVAEVAEMAYMDTYNHEKLLDEIEEFKAELAGWGISMATLARKAPKHKKLREEYAMAVTSALDSPDIIQTIRLKHYFPVNALAKITGLSQNKLERGRCFILASILIKLGDYDFLAEYVMERR